MKHEVLERLTAGGVRVPPFIVVRRETDIDLSFSDASSFAVRSSFGGEDAASASFAGQFLTELFVPRAEVAAAVRRVKDSALSEHVRDYAAARGLTVGDGAVIVQEMVHADCAGVIFTASPLGILNETVITVGYGVGDGVVSDRTDTTTYWYHRDDACWTVDGGEDTPRLSEALRTQLLETAQAVKTLVGYEADIEFAVSGETVFVLQARPITTLTGQSPIILDNANIVESYPGVTLPLTQEFVCDIYHGIFARLVRRITEDDAVCQRMAPYLEKMTDVANWRMYYRISNWYAVLRLMPFSSRIIPVWQSMLGVEHTAVTAPDIRVPFRVKWRVAKAFWRFYRHTPSYMETLITEFEQRMTRYTAAVGGTDGMEDLLALHDAIKTDVLSDWDLTLVNDMYTFIHTALAGKRHKTALADVRNLESMKPVVAMRELIATASAHGTDSEEYRRAAAQYIAQYGDRCMGELKLETVTYRTDPSKLDEYVALRLADPTPVSVPDAPAVKDKGHVAAAKCGIRYREISRLDRSRLFGLSREIFLKIGDILVKTGRLDDKRDVFYLYRRELGGEGDLRASVAERKTLEKRYAALPPYSRWVFDTRIINKTATAEEQRTDRRDVKLCGIGSSAGCVTAEVLVVEQPHERLDTRGKILVTVSTDPGWVFLMQNAAGIIAEKGSLLSHTAIIARELHTPAVVNVKDATRLLRSGDTVTLDADNGTVTVVRST